MRKINIILEYAELPISIHGASSKGNSGDYYVVLNKNDDRERQKKAFLHECLHIYNGDLDKRGNVNRVERDIRYQLNEVH